MTTRQRLRNHPQDPVQIACHHCGQKHLLEEGRPNPRDRGTGTSLFYRCGKNTFVAGHPAASIPFVRPLPRRP